MFIYLAAFLGGVLLNLMPCALPLLALKLRRPSLAYFAGILTVFIGLATLATSLNFAWGQQFELPWFSVALTLITFVFSLNYMGVWEFSVPGLRMPRYAGATGDYCIGVLCTLLMSPCSGPLLGPVFAYTLGKPSLVVYSIFGLIGLGVCTPYFFLRWLPRPGEWTLTVKRASGFLLLAMSLWLLYCVPDGYLWHTVAVMWILSVCAFIWNAHRRLSASFAVIALVFMYGILNPGFFKPSDGFHYSEAVFNEAQFDGKVVAVNFTTEFCLTCEANKLFVLHTEAVAKALRTNHVVLLEAHIRFPDALRFLQKLGYQSVPLFAVFPVHGEPIFLPDLLTKSQVIEALEQASQQRFPNAN